MRQRYTINNPDEVKTEQVDDFARRPTKPRSFQEFIWNGEKNEFLTRTCCSWGESSSDESRADFTILFLQRKSWASTSYFLPVLSRFGSRSISFSSSRWWTEDRNVSDRMASFKCPGFRSDLSQTSPATTGTSTAWDLIWTTPMMWRQRLRALTACSQVSNQWYQVDHEWHIHFW